MNTTGLIVYGKMQSLVISVQRDLIASRREGGCNSRQTILCNAICYVDYYSFDHFTHLLCVVLPKIFQQVTEFDNLELPDVIVATSL
jgi:hypothetical protein